MSIPINLQKARYELIKQRPYLTHAALAVIPVECPEIETLAVDQHWRLYFNPSFVKACSVEELMAIFMHEIEHLLRNHAGRLTQYDRTIANIAADIEINDGEDPLYEKLLAPLTPQKFGLPSGLLAEEYAEHLEKQKNSGALQVRQGKASGPQAGSGGTADENKKGTAAGTSQRAVSSPSSDENKKDTAAGTSQCAVSSPSSAASNASSCSVDAEGVGPDNNSASSSQVSASGTGQNTAGLAGTNASSVSSLSPTEQAGAGEKIQPLPGAGRCGSCATGMPEWWEHPSDGSPGISMTEAEIIRRQVAVAIREHSQSRGTMPEGLKRWAEGYEALRSKVDWRRVLAAELRAAMSRAAGAVDYTYSRPPRRQAAIPNVILPSLYQPTPPIAVVVDTSGSISDSMLVQASAEVQKILDAIGRQEAVHVLACDAKVHTIQRVWNARQMKLLGGGGTNMGVGINEALKLFPTPRVIVVLTDGLTPWPSVPPLGVTVIVALLGKEGCVPPEWARVVEIGGDGG